MSRLSEPRPADEPPISRSQAGVHGPAGTPTTPAPTASASPLALPPADPDQAPLVSLRSVGKSYRIGNNDVQILENITLDIRRGEYVALMGPSGSGKSTLLNLIAGLDRPTQGHIQIDGVDITNMDERAQADWRAANVGFVFQFYNLMPVLTALENVELPLLLTSLSRRERRLHAEAALRMVGLVDRDGHRPNELSGGQQQRVAIARAIVTDPVILVADEPTGDLDRATGDEILALLQRLHEDLGKTIVMVTHDPKAASHARRLIHLDKGELMAGAREHL